MTQKQASLGQPAVYNLTTPTFNDGDDGAIQIDSTGNAKSTLATLIAGEDLPNNRLVVEERYTYLNIPAGTVTTVVKSGAGFLHTVTINTKGAASNTLTIYDNTAASGTKIATLDTTGQTNSLFYDVSFATGLTIISATGTGADLTISYR